MDLIYVCVPGPAWHVAGTSQRFLNWTGISTLPANVTAMETESYPKAFVALQV